MLNLESSGRKMEAKKPFGFKALRKELKPGIAVFALSCICLIITVLAVSWIGVVKQLKIIGEGYDALSGLSNMTIFSYFDGSFFDVITNLNDTQIAAVGRMIMLIMFISYASFIALLIVLLFVKKKKEPELVDVVRKPDAKLFLESLAFVAILNLILESIVVALMDTSFASAETLRKINIISTSGGTFLTLAVSGILTPVVEEIFFRFCLQRALSKFSPVVSLVFVSLSFGILHVSLIQIVFAVIMGFVLGIIFEMTDNILYPIAMHIYINVSGCIIGLFGLPELVTYLLFAIIPLFFSIFVILLQKRRQAV